MTIDIFIGFLLVEAICLLLFSTMFISPDLETWSTRSKFCLESFIVNLYSSPFISLC